MTCDEIIELAVAAQLIDHRDTAASLPADFVASLNEFAALVSATEREACAKVCEELSLSQSSEWEAATMDCASAIRARGNT